MKAAFVFAILLLAAVVSARNTILIDDFEPNLPSLSVETDQFGNFISASRFQDSVSGFPPIIGGQRDVYLTLDAPAFVQATVSVTQSRISGAYAQSSSGIVRVSWDGSADSDATQPDPVPGLNGVDFTISGSFSMLVNITTDHEVEYIFRIYTAGVFSERSIDVPDVGDDELPQIFLLTFDSFIGGADFTQVDAVEMVINFNITGAIDTAVNIITIFEYEICGFAYLDCNSNSVFDNGEEDFIGLDFDLLNAAGNVVLDQIATDSNGEFCFTGLAAGSYQVCVNEPTGVVVTTPVTPTVGCYDVVLTGFADVLGLEYGLFIGDVVFAPEDELLECGDSTFPINTGFATGDSCGTPSITFTDVITGVCPEVITRTWSNNGAAFDNQVITVADTTDPTITAPAVDETEDCDEADMAAWVANNAGATCSDCTSCSFTNNWNGVSPSPCETIEVDFVASDPCGNFAVTSANYTTVDNGDPVITLGEATLDVECSATTTNAYNSWLNRFASASVSDNCFSSGALTLSFSNDDGIVAPGCADSDTVTFTATDPCGNFGQADGTFSYSDSLAPTITLPAVDSTVPCNDQSSAAFTTFVDGSAGSAATDSCNLVSVTNDAGAAPSGCDASTIVTFFYSDACGNGPATTSATFRVVDNAGPTITVAASDLTVDCAAGNSQTEFNNWLTTAGGAVATDVCDGGSIAFTNNAGSVPTGSCAGVTVTFTATDSCGFSASTAAMFSVVDTEPPAILSPAVDDSAECDNDAVTNYQAWVASRAGFDATDACTTTTFTDNAPATIPTGCTSVVNVNFIASDLCGNSVGDSASFTISDSTPPTFTSFAIDETVECNQNPQAAYQSWLNSNAGATGTDVCTSVSFTNDGPGSAPFDGCDTSTTVNFFLSDQCGNTVSASASFLIQDNTPPTLDSPAVDQTLVCDGTLNQVPFTNWVNANGLAQFSDDCSILTITNDAPPSLTGDQCGAGATVTFTACDVCGRCVSSVGIFFSSDDVPPNLVSPAQDLTVQCDGNNNSGDYQAWLDDAGGAVAVDTCTPSQNLIVSNNAGSVFGCDFVDVTFTISDPCGNSVTSEATFTAIDDIVPTFNPQASSLAVECDGSGNNADYADWISTRAGSVATDVCALVITFTDNSAAGTQPTTCPESQIVSFFASDECGNTASTSATYSIIDTVDPIFSQSPQDDEVECDRLTSDNLDDFNGWLSANAFATGLDTCSGTVISHNNPQLITNGNCQADTVVNFVVTDNCGNSVSESATFSVLDRTPPVITTPAADLDLECGPATTGQINSWLAQNGGAVATDGCSVTVSSSNDFVSAPSACVTGDVITFFFTDLCGLSVSTSATLTIDDQAPPVFNPFPRNITVGCDQSTDPSTTGIPTVSDVCDSNPSLTFTDSVTSLPDEAFCPGDEITIRTWFSIDACGNAVARDQEIVQEFALSTGPCTPSECPPCEDVQCCEENLEPVPCNPVACTAVPCTTVQCTSVPCNPVNCGDPVYEDDDDFCDPVYIYIFDDDEDFTTDLSGSVQFVPDDDDDEGEELGDNDDDDDDGTPSPSSSASVMQISTLLVVAVVVAVLF